MFRTVSLCLFLSPMPVAAGDIDVGQRWFRLHCVACHGTDARGTGSMVPVLKRNPADLTVLAKRNKGTFPVKATIKHIDGRSQLAGHGGEMPVYGWFFDGPKVSVQSKSGDNITTSKPVAQIILWLETIQR